MSQFDLLLTLNNAAAGKEFQEYLIKLSKGELLVGTAEAPTKLPAAQDGYLLGYDSTTPTGLKAFPKADFQLAMNYSELIDAVNANELIPGMSILITDYKSTYNQPVTNIAMEGNLEPIVVQALTSSALKTIAYSTLFPQDVLYYDVNNKNGSTMGNIFRRIDTAQRNDLGFDFRQIKFRRWQIASSGPYITNNGYASPQSTNWCGYTVDADDFNDFYFFAGNYSSCTDNTVAGGISNTIVGSAFKYNHFGTGSNNNSFGNFCFGNSFGASFTDNSFEDRVSYNVFGFGCKSNSFKTTVNHNIFGAGFFKNDIGAYFEQNSFGASCAFNIMVDSFKNNSFGSNCNNNSFESSCENNIFGNSITGNIFGGDYQNNSLGGYSSNNIFGDYCRNNVLGMSCSYNECGDYFENNNLVGNFNYNKLDNNCKHNTFIGVSKNLLLITELYNKSYPHEIIKTDGNKVLIRWYDSTGVMQTELVP